MGRDLIAGAILGRLLRVWTLQSLPLITEKVLLIEVDYLVTPKSAGLSVIGGPTWSHNESVSLLLDPNHFWVHTVLGKLYALQRKIDAAIIVLRMGIAAGDNGWVVRSRLVRRYLNIRQWAEVGQEVCAAIKMSPRDIGNAIQPAWYHMRQAFKAKCRPLKGSK